MENAGIGLHSTPLLKSCEHLYAVFMIFLKNIFIMPYILLLSGQGARNWNLFPTCFKACLCVQLPFHALLRLDMNISPIVDKERGTERRLAGQVLSGDRERSRISIESQATLEWGQPKCHPLDLGSEKQKQKTSLAHCSLVDRNEKLFTC